HTTSSLFPYTTLFRSNDRIDTYQYLASYGFASASKEIYVFNENVESKILRELRIPNRNVTWEVANQSNIGLDASFLNSKLTLSRSEEHTSELQSRENL